MPWEPNELEQQRIIKMQRLIDSGVDPYPRRAKRTHTAAEAVAILEHDQIEPTPVTLCGRLRSVRTMGKVAFAHIEDGSGRIHGARPVQ